MYGEVKRAEVLSLVRSGTSVRKVVNQTGVSERTIRRWEKEILSKSSDTQKNHNKREEFLKDEINFCIETGFYDNALELINSAKEEFPYQNWIISKEIKVLTIEGRLVEAEEKARKLMGEHQIDFAINQLIKILMHQRRFKEAEVLALKPLSNVDSLGTDIKSMYLKRILGVYEEKRKAEERYNDDPTDLQAIYKYVETLKINSEFGQALSVSNTAAKLHPNNKYIHVLVNSLTNPSTLSTTQNTTESVVGYQYRLINNNQLRNTK